MSVENNYEEDYFSENENIGGLPLSESTIYNIANNNSIELTAEEIGKALSSKFNREDIEKFCEIVVESYTNRKALYDKDDNELSDALNEAGELFQDDKKRGDEQSSRDEYF